MMNNTNTSHIECSLKVDMGTFSLKEEYNKKKGNISNIIVLTRLQQWLCMALQVKGHFASQAKYSFQPFELTIISN